MNMNGDVVMDISIFLYHLNLTSHMVLPIKGEKPPTKWGYKRKMMYFMASKLGPNCEISLNNA